MVSTDDSRCDEVQLLYIKIIVQASRVQDQLVVFDWCNLGLICRLFWNLKSTTKTVLFISLSTNSLTEAGLAQSVEHLTAEGEVSGSIPGVGPTLT